MKKARLNYWVDLVTGLAFVFVAVTGVVRMFPDAAGVSSSGTAVILGISSAVWTAVHDVSGVVMAAGVGLHTVLHLGWLVRMSRNLFTADRRRVVCEPAPNASRREATPARPGASPLPCPDETASLARLSAMGGPPVAERSPGGPDESPRISRKTFLAGATAVGGAALLVGAGVVQRGFSPADASTASNGSGAYGSGYGSGGSGESGSSSSGGPSNGGGTSSGDATTVSRVSVDSGACTGCGGCVQACPHGVFTMDGSTANPVSPDSCTLCGHCLQVCRPQAITLNG